MKRALIGVVGLALSAAAAANGPRFYPDDPVSVYPEPADASAVQPREASEVFDYLDNSFGKPGERVVRRAMNVSTLDEVPDSSWFTNRIGTRPMSIDELVKGPDQSNGPVGRRWKVVKAKTEGAAPGFVMRDSEGQLFFVKLDPPGHPEMATGAEVVATKIFHALGYYVPENYIARIRRADLDIAPDDNGKSRSVKARDIDGMLARAASSPDGSYRLVASKALPGKPLGPFEYHGTRWDDPNDVIPHEHRRELRAMRVFSAWVNNADLRGHNSLDTLIRVGNRSIVRHHLLDFGSTLGSGATQPKSPRSGYETLLDKRQSLVRIATFGFVVPGWARVPYPAHPAVGLFEADHFDPVEWTPHYQNVAYHTMRPDDAFWAARRVMALSDEAIRAIVRAQYSDRAVEKYIGDTLIARRDKIGRAWLTAVNPVVDFKLDPGGVLTFENAAVVHRVASAPAEYRITWAWFDNQSHALTPFGGETIVREARATAPHGLNHRHDSCYLRIEVRTIHPQFRSWGQPVQVFFRHDAQGWKTLGVDRLPA